MQRSLRGVSAGVAALLLIGTLAGLWGAYKRFRVEQRNRRIEIAVEWAEVSLLAQMSQQALPDVLTRLREQMVSTLVIAEDSLLTLEQTGALHPTRMTAPDGRFGTQVTVDSPVTFQRIQTSLRAHGIRVNAVTNGDMSPPQGGTLFVLPRSADRAEPQAEVVSVGYANLRPIGMGLPPEAVASAKAAKLRIAGRIGNFPGVTVQSANVVLKALHDQGATLVIFNGDEVLGYRGLEKQVADTFRTEGEADSPNTPSGLTYGAVEFGKQKGDEKISASLHGDYVRVHSIQGAEMGQLDEIEAIERFVRAAKERNIRFCYVRLFTQAGEDPVGENVEFLRKIRRGMEKGNPFTGGGLEFGQARKFLETGVSPLLFLCLGLGVAAGTVWMLRAICPLPEPLTLLLLVGLSFICAGLAAGAGETGRKIVALLAGIVFPAAACLRTYPRTNSESTTASSNGNSPSHSLPVLVSLSRALRSLLLATAITSIGIVHVVGLLASRPFMLRANQYLGIKLQHIVPLLIVALVAIAGGVALRGETWERFRERIADRLRLLLNEPVRFGLLIAGGIALFALMLLVARTGNDAGVGVSGAEMKFRAVLDRLLPVRPRTKEFLVGHPAFLLGLAWWWRGRRRLAVPLLIVGSLGPVSLLNTFCHIHTPLIVSLWRGGIGLFLGAIIGSTIFLIAERFFAAPGTQAQHESML